MNTLVHILAKSGLLTKDLDYHLIRASMVLIFLAFGYQKWFAYEAQVLIPYISNGPLIFWLYPVFGIRGASWFLGASEWLFGALLFLGFWNKRLGILGAIGSTATFVGTVTIIPFMPNGWDPVAGFPAMAGNVPFLMKDVVLLAVSIYLLKQDVQRVLDPPPLKWSDLKYVFWHQGGLLCRRNGTRLKRSSRSCGRSMCWSQRVRISLTRSARSV
jgi:uncharacterized membrane protein YkgB